MAIVIPGWWWAAAALAGAAAAGAWWLKWRRRLTPEQIERNRRLRLNAMGRMGSGEIIEMLEVKGENGGELAPTLVYEYEVRGVKYQVSQALHMVEATFEPQSWIPGWPVQVKFDPANPGNSIVACEHWSGLTTAKGRRLQTSAAKGGS
ncbi:MAG: DUF3592 domain-containing protein [Terriglobales bacterium]